MSNHLCLLKNHILTIFLISILSCDSKLKPVVTGKEGETIPSFAILMPDSITYYRTEATNNNGPIALIYFGPDCPFSKRQMNIILDSIKELRRYKFILLTTWSFSEMREFYDSYKLKEYPNIIVGTDFMISFQRYFQAKGVPFTAIYGTDRRLKAAFLGVISSSQFGSYIRN